MKSRDLTCESCKRVGRVSKCERCGAKRCPHHMKQTKTGYVCDRQCSREEGAVIEMAEAIVNNPDIYGEAAATALTTRVEALRRARCGFGSR